MAIFDGVIVQLAEVLKPVSGVIDPGKAMLAKFVKL